MNTPENPSASLPGSDDDHDEIQQIIEGAPAPVVPPVSNATEQDIIDDKDDTPDEVDTIDSDTVMALSPDTSTDTGPTSGELSFPEDMIDLRYETREHLIEVLRKNEAQIGPAELDARVRTEGSWQNLILRAIQEPNGEQMRIQKALDSLSEEDRAGLNYRLQRNGKTLLRASSVRKNVAPGETKSFSGDEAVEAFSFQSSGGGYRIPLYNSGISIDIVKPTGVDVQTLLANCQQFDDQLGSASGSHYFAYNDLVLKSQIMNFIQPLIINCSYADWRKRGKLWSIIKLPDLEALVATLAALCYPKGFDGFMIRCTNMGSDEPKVAACNHVETITLDIFKLIQTRFAAMSESAINFMVETRTTAKHTAAQILKYQADLGIEGERITVGNITFVMRVPSLIDHSEAGNKFIADIINEIEGDNTEGRYEQFGFRYIRTFLPWIASVESKGDQGDVITTSEPKVIVRLLEQIQDSDEDDKILDTLRAYVNKAQLTYVGYPATACPSCGFTADSPSGMITLDPFTTFFILAFLYLKPVTSTTLA